MLLEEVGGLLFLVCVCVFKLINRHGLCLYMYNATMLKPCFTTAEATTMMSVAKVAIPRQAR